MDARAAPRSLEWWERRGHPPLGQGPQRPCLDVAPLWGNRQAQNQQGGPRCLLIFVERHRPGWRREAPRVLENLDAVVSAAVLGNAIRRANISESKCCKRPSGPTRKRPCHQFGHPTTGGKCVLKTVHGYNDHVQWAFLFDPATRPSPGTVAGPRAVRTCEETLNQPLTRVKYEKYMTNFTFEQFVLLAFPS